MKTSETQTGLISALFAARQVFPVIAKTKEGQSGNRRFFYSPLEDIKAATEPALTANGLMLTQGTDGHNLVTRLDHISGEWRESTMPVNAEHANMQSYGIEITYRRRYAYNLMLGIVTEDDTDGDGARGRKRGVDLTKDRNANGTEKLPGGAVNVSRMAFEALQPDIQNNFRKIAPQVAAAIPDVVKAIDIMEIAMDNWPDEDRNELKKGLWFLLDSATRTAISKEQKK
ncbi:MAG: ERF family protein [Xanthomonadales bacterium]|nr:ERF family protein [Xanthomonadales bacterium]